MDHQRRKLLFLLSASGLLAAGCRVTPLQSMNSPSADQAELGDILLDYSNPLAGLDDDAIRDRLEASARNESGNLASRRLTGERLKLLHQTVAHLERVRKLVGHGNFALLGFDEMLHYASNYPDVGEFSRRELDFFEEIFETDARDYGFMGEKVIGNLSGEIRQKDTYKVPHTGNYLYRSESLRLYHRLQKDVGEELVLTSGIRGVVKQLYLFLAKAVQTGGDLALASHSLAPPGYSYHGIGDFDVGKRSLGYANFTEEFADTDVFQKLVQLGYVNIRYTSGNTLGVRYEPWHIKVI